MSVDKEESGLNEYLGVEKQNFNLIKTIYFAFFISGITSISLGLILPFLKVENSLTYEQTGLFLSANQIGNTLAVLFAGFLPYAIGRKQSTILMGSGIFVGMALLVFTKSPILLFIGFILIGIGRGTMTNVGNVTIAEYSTKKSVAVNILHAVFATGALLSPLLFYISTSLSDSFRIGAFIIVVLAFFGIVLLASSKLSTTPTQKVKNGTWAFIKSFSFWIDSLILFFYICVESSIIGWFVIYFYDLGILPDIVCNFTPSMLWFMILLGRLFCANISGKVNKNRLIFVMGLSLVVFFTMLLFSNTAIIAIIALLGIGFTMAGIYPMTISTMKGTDNTIQMGFALSFATAGGIFMPTIVGNVADTRGIETGIFMVLLSLLVMMILISIKCIKLKDN